MGIRGHNTVLLVDDDSMVLAGLRRGLSKEPYNILTATSASEALDVLDTCNVDAVVSDQDMPGMNGTALLKEVRDRHPLTVRFMLTGKPTLEVAMDAVNQGEITRFFTKPCDVADMALSLRQSLRQKELMEEARRLLARAQRQERLLKDLGIEGDGLLEVDRDPEGVILLEEIPTDLDELCDAIEQLIGDPSDEPAPAGES